MSNILCHIQQSTIWSKKATTINQYSCFLYCEISFIQSKKLTLVQGEICSHFGAAQVCFRHGLVFGINGGCFICWQYLSLTVWPLLRTGGFTLLLRTNSRIQTRRRLRVPFPHSAEHWFFSNGFDIMNDQNWVWFVSKKKSHLNLPGSIDFSIWSDNTLEHYAVVYSRDNLWYWRDVDHPGKLLVWIACNCHYTWNVMRKFN